MDSIYKSEKYFKLWSNVLLWVNYLMLLVGLFVAFAGNSLVFVWHNEGTFELFNQGIEFLGQMLAFKNWLFGIIGATMVGFNVLAVFIIRFALTKKEIWAWNALFNGIMIWFMIDSGISYYYGAYFNIYLVNLPALLAFLVPLYFIRKALVKM